jgi:tetratricopeptide (TPR) repeat protein
MMVEIVRMKDMRASGGKEAHGARMQMAAVVALVLALAGCASKDVVTTYPGNPIPEPPPPVPEAPSQAEFQRARLLADMLYDAKAAYDDNRLMLPAGNNAYEMYQQVLQFDPGNAVAMEGIKEIARRYVSLADAAINQGKYDEAGGYLGRAERLSPDEPELAASRMRLEEARQNKVEIHQLDPSALRAQNLDIMTRLGDIAQQIQSSEATFLINARSDEEGRWIYKTMRDAVGGYRLRGNIAIAGEPSILVNVPSK